MKIDNIELDEVMRPIRSSTLTPSISASTIMAGNIDVYLDDFDDDLTNEVSSNKPNSDDSDNGDSNDFFSQYATPTKRKKQSLKTLHNGHQAREKTSNYSD